MPTPDKHRLTIPEWSPTSPDAHLTNLRELDRFGNNLPFFDPLIVNAVMPVWSSASGSYTDLGGSGWVQGTFSKYDDISDIAAHIDVGMYATGAIGQVIAGLDFNGAITDMKHYFFNTLSDHRSFGSDIRITGLKAGIYTVTLRVQGSGGGFTMTSNANDTSSFLVRETVPIL